MLIGAGMKRARDMRDIVFGSAEHHLGLVAARHMAQIAEEFIAIHDRHVPVEQDRLGQSALADFQRLLAVLGFDDVEIEALPGFRLATFRMTLESSTTRQVFISASASSGSRKGRLRCNSDLCSARRRSYAASMSGTISETRSTSSTTMSCPSRRCRPSASFAIRGSRLTGLSSRPSSASFSTSPI